MDNEKECEIHLQFINYHIMYKSLIMLGIMIVAIKF